MSGDTLKAIAFILSVVALTVSVAALIGTLAMRNRDK
jgi:hypothetical protein